MNKCVVIAAALAVSAFGIVGCDKEAEKPATPAAPANGTANQVDNAARDGVDAAVGAVDAVKAQADGLIKQAQEYIAAKKFDDAQNVIDQLKALSDKLPDDYKARIEQLVNAFNTAKAAAGNLPANVPGLGGN